MPQPGPLSKRDGPPADIDRRFSAEIDSSRVFLLKW